MGKIGAADSWEDTTKDAIRKTENGTFGEKIIWGIAKDRIIIRKMA